VRLGASAKIQFHFYRQAANFISLTAEIAEIAELFRFLRPENLSPRSLRTPWLNNLRLLCALGVLAVKKSLVQLMLKFAT
jgi:hypothetical protein